MIFKIKAEIVYLNSYKLQKYISFSYEVENARNLLRWNCMDEHYAMEMDWNRLELEKILG